MTAEEAYDLLVMDVTTGQRSAIHCSPATTIAEATRIMRASGVDSVVIVHGGRMVGVLTERVLVAGIASGGLHGDDRVELVMSREVLHLQHLERSP
jgi:CBS domain-containing protein